MKLHIEEKSSRVYDLGIFIYEMSIYEMSSNEMSQHNLLCKLNETKPGFDNLKINCGDGAEGNENRK